ncbi:MAG: sigma-70 family RNA polymerase sigma factor [Candidatus Rifleibacteriota bacterium]
MKSDERQNEDLFLISKIRTGDSSCLERLIDKYIPQLIGFFRYLRVPEAMVEDMVQETLEKVIRKLDSYDTDKKFSAWLLTIGRNHYFDERRKILRQKDKQIEIEIPFQATPEEEVIVRHSASELLAALSEQERFLVDLRVFQGLPFAEIAEITGENESTLRSRFFRTLGRLRLANRKVMANEE